MKQQNINLTLFSMLISLFIILIGQDIALCEGQSTIEFKITLDKQLYNVGEYITAVCEIRNISDSNIWLPPLQFVNVHFDLYCDHSGILPFEIPTMSLYGPDGQRFIELLPDQVHIFERLLSRPAYKLPVVAGKYRLCASYQNNRYLMPNYDDDGHLVREINLWVGKIESCAFLKIREP